MACRPPVPIARRLLRWLPAFGLAARLLAEPSDGAPAPHWAFQPIRPTRPPELADTPHPVDRFIRAAQAALALEIAPRADRRTLIRRASFLLTGLPPTPSETRAFLADTAPGAWDRVVDRLLASPAYGERWGRWWLDLARYADTNGQDENKVMANAWRYRDWVIRQFNADTPFDRFITEQLAGDLLPVEGVPEAAVFDRWIATGFLVLGPKMLAEQDKPKLTMDIVDEQIDTVSRAFLGLTVSCARCHDHKFDPIPTRDYYALAGIFRSTRTMANLAFVSRVNERDVTPAGRREALERHGAAVDAARLALDSAQRTAFAELQARREAAFPDRLSEALEADAPVPAGEDPAVGQLRGLIASPETPPGVAGLLRHLASTPPGSADWIRFREDGTDPTAPRFTEGRVGRGFLATGTNFLERPHHPDLEPARLTLEAWVRAPAFPGEGDARRWVAAKNANEWAEGHYALMLDRDRPGACLNIGGGRENVFLAWADEVRLQPDRWHHLALTYDGNLLRLWVDGREAGRASVGRERTPGTGPLALGRRPDGFVHFRGSLDRVRLHRRALDPVEIAAAHAHPEAPSTAGIPGDWDFDHPADGEAAAALHAETWSRVFGEGGPMALPADPEPLLPEADRTRLQELARSLAELEAHSPEPPGAALAVADAPTVDLPIHRRGSHLSPDGEPVPRGVLTRVGAPPSVEVATDRSGRLALARWLTREDQPLTSRVIVNRVWQAHFGKGIVPTSENFGRTGSAPTHPELLDWLASGFMQSGWSLKHLHRLLLTSATWQQSGPGNPPDRPAASDPFEAARRRDPENLLLWSFPRQRLEAEMIRDALLAVSGRLDPAIGGSLTSWKNDEYVPGGDVAATSMRRSVYLPVVRDRVTDALALFDFANPAVGTARRTPTVVAHQALFFLNSPQVRDAARALADRLLSEPAATDSDRIRTGWELVYGRPPDDPETAGARAFLESLPADQRPTAWADWAQVLLAANEFVYIE